MKLLITGGYGFIGHNAVKYFLEQGHQIVVIDKCTYAADPHRLENLKQHIVQYRLDIATLPWPYILGKEKPDAIINYAASTHVDNSILDANEFIHSNYTGVYKILSGIRDYQKQLKPTQYKRPLFINISTDEVYGDLPLDSTREFVETDPLCPNNPYSATKAAADLLIQAVSHTYKDIDYVICRAANNYGPGQHKEKFLPTIISSVLKKAQVPLYGDGSNVREWLWVNDFVSGIQHILDAYRSCPASVLGQIFNFGSRERYTNLEVVKKVLKAMGESENLISFVPDRPGHDRKYAINFDKSNKILDWSPIKNFESGLLEVIQDMVKTSIK